MAQVDITGDVQDMSHDDKLRLLEEVRLSRELLKTQPNQARIPHIPSFNGEPKGYDYKYWKGSIEILRPTYSETSILQAIRKSLTGQPAQIVGNMGIDCSLNQVLAALDTAYDPVFDTASAWQDFYSAKQLPKESIVEWHTRLTRLWKMIPDHGDPKQHIKTKLWSGLYSENIKESSRHKYDDDIVSEREFVTYLRRLVDNRNQRSCATVVENTEVDELRTQVASLTEQMRLMNNPKANKQAKGQHHEKHQQQQQSQVSVQQQNPQPFTHNSNSKYHQGYRQQFPNNDYQQPSYNPGQTSQYYRSPPRFYQNQNPQNYRRPPQRFHQTQYSNYYQGQSYDEPYQGQPYASYHGQPQAYQDTRRTHPRNHLN